MSNIEKFLQSQQGLAQSHSNLQSQFNQTYNLERQIYAAKQQALGSAKALVGQQLGQERLEAILGVAPVAKKVGTSLVRAARDPERAAQEIRAGVSRVGQDIQRRGQAIADRFKAPLDDARERFSRVADDAGEQAERVTESLRGGIVSDARRTAGLPERGSEFDDIGDDPELVFGLNRPSIAARFSDTRPPIAPARDLPEPEQVDFRTFQAPTQEEGMAAVRAENQRLAAQKAEADRLETIRNIDPAEVRPPENVQSQIKDLSGHSLRPTETREADPLQDIDPQEIGLQLPKVEGVAEQAISTRIPVSQARALRFTEADFPPPPRELRNIPRQAEPTGSYQRPGTEYRVQSNRSNPDEASEPEPNPIEPEPIREVEAEQPVEPEPTSAEELSSRLSDIRSGIEQSTQEALREQPSSTDDIFERFRQQAQQRIRDAPEPEPSRPLPGERPEDFPDVPQTAGGEEQRASGGIDDELESRLSRLTKPDPSVPVEGADAERTAAFVGREAATTAAETGGELAAEAPLLEVPGLGEIALAATLIGSLVHGEKEAKQETEATPGPAPTPQKAPTPYINFDAAPTLDTSSYHQN